MKKIISFSLEEEIIERIKTKFSQSRNFRNKSHLVEYALERYLENE